MALSLIHPTMSSASGIGAGGEQRLCIGMRRGVHALGIQDLDDAAAPHHGDAMRDLAHQIKIVGDEQIGRPVLPAQIEQQADHRRLDRHIQRGRRLVAHHQCRARGKGAGDGDALFLAA